MPIIPTYRRQERYQAPGVQTGAPAPQRLGRAYENTLQEFGSFSSQALAYLQRQPEKEEKKGRSSAAASGVENRLSSLSFEKAENTGGQAEKSSVQADEDLQLRLDLASSVRERVSEGRAVEPSDLDEFAAQRLTPQQADTPAARDYLMLRRAAQEEQALQTRGQNIRAARQEENLVRTVGATASSAAALDAYLEAQLPALEKRLQENGSDPKNLARQLAGVRAQTALENVRRSVAAGNYSAAQEVFSRYEKEMTPRQREECREKIRLSAAEGYANRLWNRAQAETDGTPVDCSYMRLGGLSGTGYEVNGLSLPAAEVRQACYYDTYAFFGLPGFGVLTQGDYMGNVNYARGKLTGEMRRADDGTCLYYAYFYDVMGNVVKTVSSDIRGEQEITETDWSFTGQPLTVRRTHLGNHDLDETYTYTYDVMDRPVSVKHRLGSNTEVTLAEYTYDALGRMKAKSVHNGTYSTEYAYNIRSWLTSISGSKFSQALHYEDGTGTPYHNGNLSSMTWKAGEEAVTRGYRFAYDGLDRLTSATYGEGSAISANADRFTEKVTAYDLNGNILALQRYGRTGADSYGLVDDLTIMLDGDRLDRVDDAAGTNAYGGGFEFRDGTRQDKEYAYDHNGNLAKDLNKNVLSVEYNSCESGVENSF